MSIYDTWKSVHLLYVGKQGRGLTWKELSDAGIDCWPDTGAELMPQGIIEEVNKKFVVSSVARCFLRSFLVARCRHEGDFWIDYPEALVIMPSSEVWTEEVYQRMIEPAAHGAGLNCGRADFKVGDIRDAIWRSMRRAGLVIADISEPNVNVFYELGLTHGFGKDTILLKRRGTRLPANCEGFLYVEYELGELERGCQLLLREFARWAEEHRVERVRRLIDGKQAL